MTGTYHLVTLGCPKNQVDSDKLAGTLAADGMQAVDGAGEAVGRSPVLGLVHQHQRDSCAGPHRSGERQEART